MSQKTNNRTAVLTNATMLRLLPGGLTCEDPGDARVLVQRAADEAVEETTLADFVREAGSVPLWLVISSADSVMTSVTLSRKQARHLQKVLPYLLEEILIGAPGDFWYSWGAPGENIWPVIAVQRDRLARLREYLLSSDQDIRGASTDGALLAPQAPVRLTDTAGTLLVPDPFRALSVDRDNESVVTGALDIDLPEDCRQLEGDAEAFAALRRTIAEGQAIELFHDEMKPPRRHQHQASGTLLEWRPLVILAASVWLVAAVLMGIQQWRYEKAATEARERAAASYQRLFPGDSASAGLRRQFQARLNRLGGGSPGGGGFLPLMEPVGEVLAGYAGEGITSKRFRYDERQGQLMVDLQAGSFDVLEQVRSELQKQGLTAEIATARNEGDGVKARLQVERG